MSKSVLIIGCGDLGTRLGIDMVDEGWSVYGMRRNISQLPQKIKGISIDLYQTDMPQNWPKQPIDYVVFCVAPNKDDHFDYDRLYCNGLKNVLLWLKQSKQQPKHLFVVSSTAVYAQDNGEWVDENSPTTPSSSQGKSMLAMEQLAFTSDISTTSIRLSGIYGPGRTYLINQARQGVFYPDQPLLYTNRIYISDAANLIHKLVNYHQVGHSLSDYYIGVDDVPSSIQEVLTWLQTKLGIFELHTQLTQRRAGSKKLSNKLAKSIGWQPEYPSYKEGYTLLLKDLI